MKLQYISQGKNHKEHIVGIVAACRAVVRWVQLRVKNMKMLETVELAKEVRKVCDEYKATLIINDYPLVASAVGADGVHIGKNDMSFIEARKMLGNQMIIGVTANTFQDIQSYWDLPTKIKKPDYIGLGPFKFTKTKQKLSPILGIEGYKEILSQCVSAKITVPIIAVGGIKPKDVAVLHAVGLTGVAVSSMIISSRSRKQLVKNILVELGKKSSLNRRKQVGLTSISDTPIRMRKAHFRKKIVRRMSVAEIEALANQEVPLKHSGLGPKKPKRIQE